MKEKIAALRQKISSLDAIPEEKPGLLTPVKWLVDLMIFWQNSWEDKYNRTIQFYIGFCGGILMVAGIISAMVMLPSLEILIKTILVNLAIWGLFAVLGFENLAIGIAKFVEFLLRVLIIIFTSRRRRSWFSMRLRENALQPEPGEPDTPLPQVKLVWSEDAAPANTETKTTLLQSLVVGSKDADKEDR